MSNVRDGYKMTGFGQIPMEWEMERLDEVCLINPKKEQLEDSSSVSFIGMEDVSNDGRILNLIPKRYGDVKKGYTGFANGDVLLAKITPCFENGKKAIADNLINGVGFGSTEFHVLRSTEKTHNKFVYYVISTNDFINKAEHNMTGSAGQKRVPTSFIKEYILPIPSLNEQKKISTILSKVDEQIDNVDSLIDKNEELKKGLMQKLLKKGIGHTEFKKSEIGEIPVEWEINKLEQCANIFGGYAFKSSKFISRKTDECYQVIRMGNVQHDGLKLNRNPIYIKKEDVDNKQLQYRLCDSDILITLTGTINKMDYGNVSWVESNNIFVVNQRVACIRNDNGEHINRFYYYFLKSDLFRKQFFECGVGGTGNQTNVSIGDLSKLLVCKPSVKEQEKIASILAKIDERIQQYENKKMNLEETKRGLMQQLLTGRIRV